MDYIMDLGIAGTTQVDLCDVNSGALLFGLPGICYCLTHTGKG